MWSLQQQKYKTVYKADAVSFAASNTKLITGWKFLKQKKE